MYMGDRGRKKISYMGLTKTVGDGGAWGVAHYGRF